MPNQEHPGRTLHRQAHAQPKVAPDLVHTYTLTDGHGRQFVVDVEVRAALIAQALGSYARENNGKTSRACDGGVLVRFVREVQS